MRNTQRIKLNRDFRRLYARGKSRSGAYVVVYAKRTGARVNRVGFTCGKSVGNAVVRNRVKRLMRESYRAKEQKIEGSYDMIIVARSRAAGKTFAQISADLGYVFHTMNITGGQAARTQ